MPYDAALADAMRDALQERSGITEKKMFGGVCWMLHGNMLCGVEVGRYLFRVGAASEGEALAKAGARPMDITGKPMRGFVWVDAPAATGHLLREWIALSERFVGALPPK
jgi:TfoX/Sxy family transcriptional regulator of competence genes